MYWPNIEILNGLQEKTFFQIAKGDRSWGAKTLNG
jgi:hypothetical protein